MAYDPKTLARLSFGTHCTVTGARPVLAEHGRVRLDCAWPKRASPPGPYQRPSTHPRAGAWTTHDPAVLQALDALHVWGPAFLEHRLRWRAQQPITVLELRAAPLRAPLQLAPQEGFFGCFSWVDLSSAAAAEGAAEAAAAVGQPALGDAAFAERQAEARRRLAQLADLQELSGF